MSTDARSDVNLLARWLGTAGFDLQVELTAPGGVAIAVYRSCAHSRALLHVTERPGAGRDVCFAIAPAREPACPAARATALLTPPAIRCNSLDALAAALIARGLAAEAELTNQGERA